MDIQDRIRTAIEASGKSARDISLSAGLSPSFLRDFLTKRGSQIGTENLKRIAKALGQSPEYLLTGRPDPDMPTDPETAEIVSILPLLKARARAEVLEFARFKAQKQSKDDKS
jgi:transcriptional regulator with XRE-family HTH domain